MLRGLNSSDFKRIMYTIVIGVALLLSAIFIVKLFTPEVDTFPEYYEPGLTGKEVA